MFPMMSVSWMVGALFLGCGVALLCYVLRRVRRLDDPGTVSPFSGATNAPW
jgi:hypothetical protein